MPDITDEQRNLIKELYGHIWQGIRSKDASSHLEWLAKQPTELVRSTILTTQPEGWAVIAEPLVKSLSDDQAVGVLAALVAVFVQAASGSKPQ